jgi:ATP adenylyltransferase/5',5'''-P-1,P-4-tetraphosphate phosphorylase II
MTEAISNKTVNELLAEQLTSWDTARTNYEALLEVESKVLDVDGHTFRVQFNPARIRSSAAKVDPKSIQERKCFLCKDNLPAAQKGLKFGEGYTVLVNPFPIFPQHLTIPAVEHKDQLIRNRFVHMLELAERLSGFVLFYNGPKCGASAPDHAHFQAGNKGFLPLESEWRSAAGEAFYSKEGTALYALKEYPAPMLVLTSDSMQKAAGLFDQIYMLLDKGMEVEPMMNLLAWYEDGQWVVCIIPRTLHRPACYFAEGEENLLISPASVDLGGVFITPLEKDFEKITSQDIRNILQEVCLKVSGLNELVNELNQVLLSEA